jgi:NitT/TauT family transport system permease protein/taurine transport system permease protein
VSGVLPFAVLGATWYLAAQAQLLPRMVLPAPGAVAAALGDLLADGRLQRNMVDSLGRLLLGSLFGIGLGVALGVLLGVRRGLANFLEPLVSFLNALSGIAWIPLAILWFGIGPVAVTFILWNSIFFLVLFNTLVGVRSVPRVYLQAVLTLGAGPRQIITDVLLPGALPNIALGMRMGLSFGWRALIAAEMVGTTSGLGFMIFDASYFLRSDVVLAGILLIGVIWLVTDRLLLAPFERWTVERWGLVHRVEL